MNERIGENPNTHGKHKDSLDALTALSWKNTSFGKMLKLYDEFNNENESFDQKKPKPPIRLVEGETRYNPGLRFAILVNQHRTGPYITPQGLKDLSIREDVTAPNRLSAKGAFHDVERFGESSLHQLTISANIITKLRVNNIRNIALLRRALAEDPWIAGLGQKGLSQARIELSRYDDARGEYEANGGSYEALV